MTDRQLLAIAPTGHLDIRKIHKSAHAAEHRFSLGEIKKRQMSPGFVPPHLAVGRADPQQPNEKKTN